jgi:ubiquinone/menaquinone biosynthesis C-methylase UbiE
MIDEFLALCPPAPLILDAACGTGKYWEVLRQHSAVISGIDQSGEMLARAKSKFSDVLTAHLGLQEIHYLPVHSFDAVICMDAMENVSQEDWPLVLANFHHVLKPGGHIYFTVELETPEAIREAYERGRAVGLPLVEGEIPFEAGYHYYPTEDQVRAWIGGAGFEILHHETGDEYDHYVCKT